MSEEEKKAIKDCDIIFINLEDMLSEESANDYRNSYKILKNLIDKQQNEIEEKSTIIMAGAEKVKQLEKEIEELKKPKYLAHFENNKITKMELINDYISKDKIREKLNQIHNEFSNILLDRTVCLEEQNLNAHRYDAIRNVLEELLEEK